MNWSGDLYAVGLTGLAVVCGAVAVRLFRKSTEKRSWGVVAGSGLSLIALLFGSIGMPALLPPAEPLPWEQPQTEQERRAYEFAHSILLPGSIPKPVPFSFARARLLALIPGMPSVAEQYFSHLCNTEAGFFVLRKVDRVEGVLQLRPVVPRRLPESGFDPTTETQLPYEGGSSEPLQLNVDRDSTGTAIGLVRRPYGRYLFAEQPNLAGPGYLRAEPIRSNAGELPRAERGGTEPNPRDFVRVEIAEASRARFAYTWRGLHRVGAVQLRLDGGELIVIDKQTAEVIGVFRRFMLTPVRYDVRNPPSRCPSPGILSDRVVLESFLQPVE